MQHLAAAGIATWDIRDGAECPRCRYAISIREESNRGGLCNHCIVNLNRDPYERWYYVDGVPMLATANDPETDWRENQP